MTRYEQAKNAYAVWGIDTGHYHPTEVVSDKTRRYLRSMIKLRSTCPVPCVGIATTWSFWTTS